jgi:hypothetical protein
MNVEIIPGNNINLNKFYTNSDISLHKHFNILSSNLFHAIIIGDDDPELYNLIIYKKSDYNTVISYLINNQYFNLNFDINLLNNFNHILSALLKHSYNMPYILDNEIYPFTILNIIYNPDINTINLKYIEYMINQYLQQNKTMCEGWATFHQPTLNKIYHRILNDKHEISGKLNINQTIDEGNKIVFEISNEKIMFNGDNKEVDSVISSYNFHTHPKEAYFSVPNHTDLGWPSLDDYIIFIMAFIIDEIPTYFHWVCTVEGIYVLTIPPETIEFITELKQNNTKKLEHKIETYIHNNIDIPKKGFRKNIGITKNNILINSPESYVKFVNQSPLFKYNTQNIKLVDISFFNWDGPLGLFNNRMYFTFYYPKVNGNCLPIHDHLRN